MALKFKNISNFKDGYAVVENFDGSFQYLHKSGNLIPGNFYYIEEGSFQDGLGKVEVKPGAYNFVDKNGNLLFEESFTSSTPSIFQGGYSKVTNNLSQDGKKFHFIDTRGKMVGNQEFKKAKEFINGFAEITTNENEVGFVNGKGKVFTDKTWEKFHNFHDGLALIKDNKGKYYYINEKGKRVGKKYTFAQDYSEGLAVVGELRKVYHYIDTNGKELKGSYKNYTKFSEGHACVTTNGTDYFLIDKNGNRINDTTFNGTIREVKDGMVLERLSNNTYNFYNLKGKKINDKPFEYAEDFQNGYASIRTGDTWTCIDKTGNYIPFTSKSHFVFSEEGLARVEINKTDLDGNEITRYKFINKDGKDATEEFDYAEDFCEGLAVVKKGNATLVIDKNGNYLGNEKQTDEQTKHTDVYGFKYRSLTNDELFHNYIDSDISVFLHGPSGVGKSSRVKQLDPTATMITLRPQMNPEEVDGTLDRENGTYIPPLWYQQLKQKCEAEPERKHILFIDELTNVKPTIQSMVYSIVLERAGKDGLWPLPDNAVVVAAGNENKNNLAAYPLTNALYRRFCHITYKIDRTDWINWATTRNKGQNIDCVKVKEEKVNSKIHPTILCYIMSNKQKVLNQSLDENNPTIVTDPRKWEIASKVLNSTKNPYSLIPAIGQNLTDDFVSFIKLVPDNLVEQVKEKGANQIKSQLEDLKLLKQRGIQGNDTNESNMDCFSAMAQLAFVEEENFQDTKTVISEVFGVKNGEIFDTIWKHNNSDEEFIAEDPNNVISKLNTQTEEKVLVIENDNNLDDTYVM